MMRLAVRCLMAFCFAGGILLPGSDGAWFPWINMAGIVLLLLVWPLSRILPEDHTIVLSSRPGPWR